MDKLPALVKARAMGWQYRDRSHCAADAFGDRHARKTPLALFARCSKASNRASTSSSAFVERRNALAARDAVDLAGARVALLDDGPPGQSHQRLGDDFHAGLDIAADRGQPVYVRDRGRHGVKQVGYLGGYGNLIVLDHGFGLENAVVTVTCSTTP